MAYSEFVEWMAFYDTEPFGEARSEIQTALIVAAVLNANRNKKSKVVKPSQFITDWWKDGSKPHAMMAKFRAATSKPVAEKPAKPKANGARIRNTGSSVSR